MRILAVTIIIGVAAATGFSQKKKFPEAKYTIAKGRCENLYFLENAPDFFANPTTKDEIEYVVRVLKSRPPESDVKCRDFTDALTPYLFADRKVEIARLLIRLKRYNEAREELWSVFSSRPLLYRKRKLFYSFGTEEAVELLAGKDLWDAKDFIKRLKSGKYVNTEELEEAYRQRLR